MGPSVVERLAAAGYSLPDPPAALGDYVPATRAGRLVFTSGQLPITAGEPLITGLVGADLDPDRACKAAALAARNALAAASTVCDLDSVVGVVKLVGYVASAEGFTAQPTVINGASAVMIAAFGEAGRHAREAVGVRRLPLDAAVEVSLILEVAE